MSITFDASKTEYRSPIGAIASGTSLRLCITLPRSFGVNACTLVLKNTHDAVSYHSMYWLNTDGETENWDICLPFETPGVYFYHFEYTTPWGKSPLRRKEDTQIGDITGTNEWQITVYPQDLSPNPDFEGGIIYQIFPDRFFCSGEPKTGVPQDRILRTDRENLPYFRPDENGKILNNDYFCGDLKGITQKLDYIASLGVTCLYLNPVAEAHSNHRYNTADYKKVDPLLGNEQDYAELCLEAHKRNIKVLFDGVYSHTGDDSIYFNRYCRYPNTGAYQDAPSPYDDWYTFKNGKNDYNAWWGIKILPEVNENTPSFTRFITGENGVLDFWFQLGADGVRLDVADELPDEFLTNVHKAVKRNGTNKLVLGEVWEDASNKISYSHRRTYFNGCELDGVMNYPFRDAVLSFMLTANAEHFMEKVQNIVLNYPPPIMNVCMNLLGTHDTERILTALTGINLNSMSREQQSRIHYEPQSLARAQKLLKTAVSILYILPGIPAIYYGDEVGMTGGKDPFNRCCFPWGNENEAILSFFRTLGQIRKQYPVLKNGGFYPLSATLGTVAFLRYREGQKRIAVIANKNAQGITYHLNPDMQNMKALTGCFSVQNGSIFVEGECAVILGDITE